MNGSSMYVKAVALLASGSMVGQLIGFVGSLFMTRIYTESEIGIMATVVAVSGIFAPVINGRFDYAIVKERDENNLLAVIALSLLFGLFAALIITLGAFLYFSFINLYISSFVAAFFVFIILIITAWTNVCRSYNNHIRDYKTMTWVIVFRRLAEELSMIVLGLLHFGGIGLLISRVVGQYSGMRRDMRNLQKRMKEVMSVKKKDIICVYDLHKKQLYFSTPAALFNAASYSLISLIIGQKYGLAVLGIYAISFAVLGLPLSVISSNVSKVYFNEASLEYDSTGSFRNSTNKTLKMMAILSVGLWCVMFFILPVVVPIFYGANFEAAGTFIKILSPMFTVRFITSSLITGYVVANKQLFEMIIEISFIVVAFFIAICKISEIEVFLLLFSFFYTLIYLFCLFFLYKFSKSN